MKKIALIEVWLGKIPEYFKYHVETIGMLSCVDFYFFTDDKDYDFSFIKHKNFILNYIDEQTFLNKFNSIAPIKVDKFSSPKKITDFKLTYFDVFSEYIKDYAYLGVYDIDVLFGDMNSVLVDSMEHYDFISVADETYHNRLSGPFIAFKNTEKIRELMRSTAYYETLLMEEIYGYGEKDLSEIALSQYKTKLIYSTNVEEKNGGKITYDCTWKNGVLLSKGKELLLYHFYNKGKTKFFAEDDEIFAMYDKTLVDDFKWVTYATSTYTILMEGLLRSIRKYSNRKCLVYSVNFDWELPPDLAVTDQFEVCRIEIPVDELDSRGRAFSVLNGKPVCLLAAIEYMPNTKFVYIDTDAALTVNADSVKKYFKELEYHPLINSHIFDTVVSRGIKPGEECSCSLRILLDEMNCSRMMYPRRKTNIIIFDKRSRWFFEEQLDLFNSLKGRTPGIFGLHDEDSANALIAKYWFTKSLPILDIDYQTNLNMESYLNWSNFTSHIPRPTDSNQIIAFHQLKSREEFEEVIADYGNSVIEPEEFVCDYQENTVLFRKNSFLTTKNLSGEFDFVVYDETDQLVCSHTSHIMEYWTFCVWNNDLTPGVYTFLIRETSTQKIVFRDLVKVKG
jgi:hypothetical protein